MKDEKAETKAVIEVLQQVHKELQQLEARLARSREIHKASIPEIKETIEVVDFLQSKEDSDEVVNTSFMVSASLFAEATLEPSRGTVVLWLGANAAAELTYEEALKLLHENLVRKEDQLKRTTEDMKTVKEQITTCEVSIARVYNNDVKQRRKAAEEDDEE